MEEHEVCGRRQQGLEQGQGEIVFFLQSVGSRGLLTELCLSGLVLRAIELLGQQKHWFDNHKPRRGPSRLRTMAQFAEGPQAHRPAESMRSGAAFGFPTIRRIMSRDGPCQLLWPFPAGIWLYAAVTFFINMADSSCTREETLEQLEITTAMATVLSAVLVPPLVFRIRSVLRLYRDGIKVTGLVTGYSPWTMSTYRVEYTHRGVFVRKRVLVPGRRFELKTGMEKGHAIELLVDQDRPRRSIVPSVFS